MLPSVAGGGSGPGALLAPFSYSALIKLVSRTASPLRLHQVLTRLTDRRIAVEKELAALGEAKKGAQDIFRHCRGFERAYSVMLQVLLFAIKLFCPVTLLHERRRVLR